MKKIVLLVLAFLLTGALLSGCGKSDPPATDSDTTATQTTDALTTAVDTEPVVEEEPSTVRYPVADAPFDPTTGMTENMIARSVYYEGDTSRLKAKLAQVFDENYTGQTNVFFFGDSISDGSGSGSEVF